MKTIRVFIEKDGGNEAVVTFDEPLVVENNTLTVKRASVFWDLNNIVNYINTLHGKTKVRFEAGYWTANMIIKKLKEHNIEAKLLHHSSKIEISSPTENFTMLDLAPLLGFSKKRQTIPKGRTLLSDFPVNVNLGLKYFNIKCNAVDTSMTLTQGRRDNTIVSLPITTTQSLKGTITHYDNITDETKLSNGIYSELKFSVDKEVGDIPLVVVIK